MIKIINIDERPIELIGANAAVCYGKPVCGDPEGNYKRGLSCIESGHGRALEYAGANVEIRGYSARCMREIYTHIVGATRLQESTRYVNMENFEYYIPDSIAKNEEALKIYNAIMEFIKIDYNNLINKFDIPVEDAANVLTLGSMSRMAFRINVRALLHLAEERMCTRAYPEIRQFIYEFKKELYCYSESMNDPQWAEIARMMKPKCQNLGYCPEKKGCGAMISKKEAMAVLKDYSQGRIGLIGAIPKEEIESAKRKVNQMVGEFFEEDHPKRDDI